MGLVYLVVAWFVGIGLASLWTANWAVWVGVGVAGLVGGAILHKRPSLARILACVGMIGLGGARYTAVVPQINQNHIAYYNDTEDVTLTGLVVDEPSVSDRSVNLRVSVDEISVARGTAVPVSGLVQVRTFRFPVIAYGTQVVLDGRLETPPEEGDFNYKAYLARQGVHSLMALPDVTIMAENQGSPIYHAIYAFKARAEATISTLLPDPQAALLTGILLGNDNGLPPDLAEAFRTTGTSHIIAISG